VTNIEGRAAPLLAELSGWIDRFGLPDATAEERLWGRTAKVAEEYGEVVAAIIGHLGQNPRKGRTHNLDDVVTELLDVAVTALGAVESIRGNDGSALILLDAKIGSVHARMRAHLLGAGALNCTCPRQEVCCDRPADAEDLRCGACRAGCVDCALLAAEDLGLHLAEDESFAAVVESLDSAVPA
jgi:hypothetical protein